MEGDILCINEPFTALFGFSGPECSAKKFSDFCADPAVWERCDHATKSDRRSCGVGKV
jgi:hypothetical protein